MPETTEPRPSDARATTDRRDGTGAATPATGLAALLDEAEDARRRRAESRGGRRLARSCAWNHFENIPTFYNWNNRPR